MYGEYTRNRILALANANKTPTEIVSILCEENIIIVRNNSRQNYTANQRENAKTAASRPPWATTKSHFTYEEENRRGLQAGSQGRCF